jgi:molybdopterin converting factor small subunit
MAVKILIPTPLRPYVDNQRAVQVDGSTVADALDDLVARHAAMRRHLFDDRGELRSFINIYVNDEDIRHLGRAGTPVAANDVISIIPSVAGGRQASWPS